MYKEYLAYIKDNPEGKWFKPKLFGWGWTPAKWQGWLTLIIFCVLIGFNTALSVDDLQTEGVNFKFLAITVVLVIILLIICYKKGGKPYWQWGVPEKYKNIK